jgi:hypothetical protein
VSNAEARLHSSLLYRRADPLKDIAVLTKPDEHLALTMEEGRVRRNTTD